MSRNRRIYLWLMALCIAGFWLFDEFYTPAPYSVEELPGWSAAELVPETFLPEKPGLELISHRYYSLGYDEDAEQAAWVAYLLRPEHLVNADRERPFFEPDPFVSTRSADWHNYKGSGYDRGHLLPAGDRRFSELAYNETFYTSNISPQQRDFNAGIWNDLEKQVRRWCRKHGPLIVVTGGVLDKGMGRIGREEVLVPGYFYKIIYREDEGSPVVAAFLLPNRPVSQSYRSFLTTVDAIEALTGIDFFEGLDPELEKTLEATESVAGW